jgi:hypothetical protein
MRRTIANLTTSLMGLLGEPTPEVSAKDRIAGIRQAMLDQLADLPSSPQVSKMRARIPYAPDLQTLWYLRADMMTLLAASLGESVATQRMAAITTLFDGLLPAAQKSRPHRLGH